MKAHDFDVIARRAAPGITRRDSLMPLGGAALAALAAPAAAAAKGKGKRKKCKKKVEKSCRRQGNECRAFVNDRCSDLDCRDLFLPCCDDLAACRAGNALTCFFPNEEA